jgi:hypothetical protein
MRDVRTFPAPSDDYIFDLSNDAKVSFGVFKCPSGA